MTEPNNNENTHDQDFDVLVRDWLEGDLAEEEKNQLVQLIQSDPELADRFVAVSRVDGLLKAHFASDGVKTELVERLHLTLPDESKKRETQRFIMERIDKVQERQAREKKRKKRGKGTTVTNIRKSKVFSQKTATSLKRQQRQPKRFPIALVTTLAACLALTVGVVYTLQHRDQAVAPVPRSLGVLEGVSGTIQLLREGNVVPLTTSMKVFSGDKVMVKGAGKVNLIYADGTSVSFGPHTLAELRQDNGGKLILLERGEATASVVPQPKGRAMVLRTDKAVATVVGTVLSLLEDANDSRLEVYEGKVQLKSVSTGERVAVDAGYYGVVHSGRQIATYSFSKPNKQVIAINCGGREVVAPDGTVFAKDSQFNGGKSVGRVVDNPFDINRTNTPALYQTSRKGTNFSYKIDLENSGWHSVTLFFAETEHGTPGERIFTVHSQGEAVVSELDVCREAGMNTGLARTFAIFVPPSRPIEIEFRSLPGKGPAFVNAIMVEPAERGIDSH